MQLAVESLSKNISGKAVLNHINFDWQPGEIIGLVGRNGAGKSTLMRTMMNQYVADEGYVAIDGEPLLKRPELKTNLVFVDGPNVFFKRMTLRRIAQTYKLAYPQFDLHRYKDLANHFKLNLSSSYAELSKGYQALVSMMISLASNATFILLDEPFDGLDVLIRESIVQMVIDEVATQKRGFLIASHNLEELDGLADRVLFLKRQTIVDDMVLEDARQHAVKLQLVFNTNGVPDIVRENGSVLSVSGRVMEVLFPHYSTDLAEKLAAEQPVLFEQLPLTLTDLFKDEFLIGGKQK